MHSFKVDYNTVSTELCDLGKIYNTDKSSQRLDSSYIRNCCAYTVFYDALFRSQKNSALNIAELGVLEGSSLRMWKDYFTNANIVGFDNDNDFLERYKCMYGLERVSLYPMDVHSEESIYNAFLETGRQYDIIIEDTTHQFQDQIRVIFKAYEFLKPGGVLIIEDIFRINKESDYFEALSSILGNFQDYYFLDIKHENQISTGWNNEKLLVLIKGGGEPIFTSVNF